MARVYPTRGGSIGSKCKSCGDVLTESNIISRKFPSGVVSINSRCRKCRLKAYLGRTKAIGSPCKSCGVILTEDNAYYYDRGAYRKYRFECMDCKDRRFREAMPMTRDEYILHRREKYHARKRAALSAVGAQHGGVFCVNCGEDFPLFISIDHVRNDGCLARKKAKNGKTVILQIEQRIKSGEGLGDYQILCHSCNLGKHLNGGVLPDIRAWRAAKNNQSHVATGDNSNFNKDN